MKLTHFNNIYDGDNGIMIIDDINDDDVNWFITNYNLNDNIKYINELIPELFCFADVSRKYFNYH